MRDKDDGKSPREELGVTKKTWTRVIFEGHMKIHWVPEEFLGNLIADINHRYDVCPSLIEQKDVLILDPGGMMMLHSKPIEFEVDGYRFDLRPEWHSRIEYRWSRGKERVGLMKVYMNSNCYLLPEDLYEKVSDKLKELEPIAERLLR